MSDDLGSKSGRPRKGAGPKVPYEELDRILVFGELVACEDGESATVHYPSYRELARRFSVSHSLVAQYARKHDCMRRRDEARARIAAKTDQKLVELRSSALAVSKNDALRIIDGYLSGFEKAIADGRVRFDNPGDFNTMLRLKEFIQGGADSRQEIHASLSLEDIQARHRRMMDVFESSSPAVRGEVPSRAALSLGHGDRGQFRGHPSCSFAPSPGKLDEQFEQATPDSSRVPGAPVSAPERRALEPAPMAARRSGSATAAHTAPRAEPVQPPEREP